jgi:hypothetical protein
MVLLQKLDVASPDETLREIRQHCRAYDPETLRLCGAMFLAVSRFGRVAACVFRV